MRANKTTYQEAAKSTARILLIAAAATIGTIGLMAEPISDRWWLEILIISKATAAAGWYAAWRLYEHWRKTDKWLAAYDKFCMESMETPNPRYIGKEDEQR